MLENDLKRYSASFMSNAKWRKFFSECNQGSLELGACTWKLVSDTEPVQGHLPDFSKLGEDYVGDCGALSGPFEFREIEWLLLPARVGYRPYDKAPMKYLSQDIEAITTKLDALGQFEYEVSEQGLKVYGYKV